MLALSFEVRGSSQLPMNCFGLYVVHTRWRKDDTTGYPLQNGVPQIVGKAHFSPFAKAASSPKFC